jgi:hypothetical protein
MIKAFSIFWIRYSNLKNNLAYNKAVKLLHRRELAKSKSIIHAHLSNEPDVSPLWYALLVEVELEGGDIDAAVHAKANAEENISKSNKITPLNKLYLHHVITSLFPDRLLTQNIEHWHFADPQELDLTKIKRLYRTTLKPDFSKKSLIHIINNHPDRVLKLIDFRLDHQSNSST